MTRSTETEATIELVPTIGPDRAERLASPRPVPLSGLGSTPWILTGKQRDRLWRPMPATT
jgi:hypothetical protein